jgi:hypothetical protein
MRDMHRVGESVVRRIGLVVVSWDVARRRASAVCRVTRISAVRPLTDVAPGGHSPAAIPLKTMSALMAVAWTAALCVGDALLILTW